MLDPLQHKVRRVDLKQLQSRDLVWFVLKPLQTLFAFYLSDAGTSGVPAASAERLGGTPSCSKTLPLHHLSPAEATWMQTYKVSPPTPDSRAALSLHNHVSLLVFVFEAVQEQHGDSITSTHF